MHRLILILALALLIPCQSAWGQSLSQKAAVALAEKFIIQNGYTNAAPDRVKAQLDFESIERAESRSEMLRQRHNTLRPKAIGARKGRKGSKAGWSIAFDYAPSVPGGRDLCRVVTMDSDGSGIRIEHVAGVRSYFVGFNEPGA
jgi:hypothetical protein